MYKGKSHAEGGIPVVVDGNTNVEIEGNEYHLCRDAMSSAKIYSFKNKSNKEILDSIYSSEGCKFVQGIANSGDFIVCKLVVLDDDKRTISGTVKSIIDTMQSEKSCNVSEGSNKMEKGGGINKCLSYIETNKKNILSNGYCHYFRSLPILKDVYAHNTEPEYLNDLQFLLITYNSTNSFSLKKEIKNLLGCSNGLAKTIVSKHLKNAKKVDESTFETYKDERIIIANRDEIVCQNVVDKMGKGGFIDEHKETYEKWKSLVNMSKSELKEFYDSQEGKDAGLSDKESNDLGISNGRESARWIMRMKDTPVSDWTPKMWEWANKQISFISRMSGNKGSLYDDKGNKTRKHTSLLIWGHNPKKMGNGGEIKDLILSKKIELNFYKTTQDHALEYGIKATNPLYLKNFHVTKSERLKGIGKKMLKYLEVYAIENGNDVIFGHINQKATFSKNNKETYFNDTQLIKNWLQDNGYAVNYDDNNFHKVVGAKMKQGGNVITYRNKFNKKYGFELNESHSLEEIAKLTSLKLSALQDIYNKGIGAYKTNPESVRPIVKSKEQWAMARVYSAVMGGKASKVDANELERGKFEDGGEIDNLFELTIYNVIAGGNNDLDTLYFGTNFNEAEQRYEYADSDDLSDSDKINGGLVEFQKKIDTYKFVYELDKEYNEEISDYPIEEYYEDRKYYKLIDEKEFETIKEKQIIGSKEIELENKNKGIDLIDEVVSVFKKKYPRYVNAGYITKNSHYFLIPIKDTDKTIELRISDHSPNLRNIDSNANEILFTELVKIGEEPKKVDRTNEDNYDVKTLNENYVEYQQIRPKNRVALINCVIYYGKDETYKKFDKETEYNLITEYFDLDNYDYDTNEVVEKIDELIEEEIYQFENNKNEVNVFSKGGNIPNSNMELLAPNGNKSNLNHEQWHLVRTPKFKAWFGDWEKLAMAKIKDSAMDEVTLANISKDVSKVVDENGEPLVVYHGSSYGGINVFDISQSKRESSGLKEYGNYFTTNKKLADFYHKKGKLEKEEVQNIDREIYKLEQLLYTIKNNRDFDSVIDEIKKLKRIKDGNVYPVFLNLKKIHEFDAKGKEEMSGWRELKVWAGYKWANNRDAMDFLKEGKFEVGKVNGIKAKNIIDAFVQGDKFLSKELLSDVYLVFSANDIKLADGTNTTFDGNNDDIRYEDGGEVSDISKVYSSSSRFKPSETIVFKPPLIGTNGAKLTAYTWAYEMTMKPNYEGELVGKRVSDWTQADSSAETGRDIVHKYTIELPNGDIKVVSSESVPMLLGYIDRSQAKVFGNLATASKTLAKQQMKLAIMEAQKKEYDELYSKFEKAQKPTITLAEISDLPPITQYVYKREIEEGKGVSLTYFKMGDVVYNQNNNYNYNEGKYIASTNPNNTTIEQLNLMWITKRVKEAGGEYPRELYDLKNRVERQKRKVEQMLNPKMGDGGEVEYKEGGEIESHENLESQIMKQQFGK